MSTILVNNIKSYTGTTVTISGSHILVQGQTTLGDGSGTDTLKVRANSSLSGSVEVSGSITPSADNTYDLGSITGNTTINGNLTFGDSTSDSVNFGAEISSSIIPDADDTYDLGSSAKQWKDLYIDGTANIDTLAGVATATFIDATVQGTATISSASIDFVSSSIIPYTDNTYDLGSAALQWNVAHLTTASVAHIQSKAGGTVVVSGSLNPLNDDKHDLGSVTREWKDVYSDGVAYLSQISASALPTSTTSAISGELYTLSGSQIFSSSAWTSGHILSGATSASLFVFLKA